MQERLVDFICIGTYKSGTTWLFKKLSSIDNIFLPDIKEINFWSSIFLDDIYVQRGLLYYHELFSRAPKGCILGDISPGYFTDLEAIGRIRKHVPNVKLICMVRNPIERAWSHYWFIKRRGGFRGLQFEDIIRGGSPSTIARLVIEQGFYAKYLKNWFSNFGEDRILVCFFEDLRSSPETLIQEICRFLEVSVHSKDLKLREKVNPAAEYRISMLVNLSYRVARWLHYNRLDWIRRFIKFTGIVNLIKRINTIYTPTPPLDSKTRNLLREIYLSDIKDFSKIVGRDVADWLK